ncbi:haloacid dehalogenase-like hydrolase [Vibrio alginolyticus]|nr:haloacid dehalogenase-like hydrolase [Vibrio alginolyticus]
MVVFDFCKTIVSCNSTFCFMKHYASTKKTFAIKFYLLCIVTKILRFFCLINDDLLTKIRVFSFRYESYDEVLSSAQKFARLLEGMEIVLPLERLQSLASNEKVIVSSNSIDFILDAYMSYKMLNAVIISSSLEVINGRFTGFYNRYLLEEGKVCSLLSVYPRAKVDEFWTDDLLADKDLVDYAESVKYVIGDSVETYK